ncbi:AMP-dependent synthetase [Cellulomonas sp. WB94]|nr:AMP-dependent synthetase [Cellulomonas sp. WB94]
MPSPEPHGDGPPTTDVLLAALAAALDGDGPAVLATPAPGAPEPEADAREVPDDVALVVQTSGSTGDARQVLLSAAALRASAAATEARLGGPGRWLLALPTTHVAGLQVLVRSVLAGTVPVAVPAGPFRADAFAAASGRLKLGAGRRYTSLVPTQLHRLLGSPDGVDALRAFDAVLLGGAAAAPSLVADARAAGIAVVTTYGMSETCGGCVYDGVPLDGVRVDLEPDGRVLLTGPVLATGYRGRPDLDAQVFVQRGGERWLRTTDVGALATDGVLTVLGRLDDVIVTGGAKVAPAAVERVLGELAGVAEACVVGLPDEEWGHAVTAVLVLRPGAPMPDLAAVRATVESSLGRSAAPRHVVVVDALPLRGPGKVDRRAAADVARRLVRPVP